MLQSLKSNLSLFRSIPQLPSLFIMQFLIGLAISFRNPFISLFGLDEAKMSNITFGFFMCIVTLCEIILATYIAKLSDSRWSRKWVILITALSGTIGYVCFAYLRNVTALTLTGAIFLGVAVATSPQLFAYFRERLTDSQLTDKQAPLAMNIFRAFATFSWILGPALGAWVLVRTGFQGLFLFGAILYFLVLLITLFSKKEPPKTKSNKEPVKLLKFIFKPKVFAALIAFLFINAAGFLSSLNIPQLVTKIYNGNEAQVGIIFSIPPIFEIPFMIWFGILAARWGNANLVRLSFLVATIYFGLLVFATEAWHIYLMQILNAVYFAIIAGNGLTYFQDFIPDELGTATTLYINVTKLGFLVSFLTFGFVSEYFGFETIQIICAVFAFLSMLIIYFFGRSKKQVASIEQTSITQT